MMSYFVRYRLDIPTNHSRQADFCDRQLSRMSSVASLTPFSCQAMDFTTCGPCNQDNKNNTRGMTDKVFGGLVP